VAIVTALRVRPRGRVSVDLDGDPWRTLPVEPVVAAGLAVGVELDRARARRLRRELRRAEGLALAARALRSRDLSSRRLAERLERGAVAPPERDAIMETVVRTDLVDDRRFASRRAAALAERGYGDAAIAADLERQAIPTALTQEAIAALEPESDRAAAIVERRGWSAKTARFLAARGFETDAVEAAAGVGFANEP